MLPGFVMTQVDLREVIVDRDLIRQCREAAEKELEWTRSQQINTIAQQKQASAALVLLKFLRCLCCRWHVLKH